MELTVRNLSKKIEDTEILRNIDLKIRSGEAAPLVGANGAGKTTLINCILNIYTKYSGEILFDGVDVKSKKCDKKRKDATFVLDTTGLFATLNAWDNIEFYDRIYHPDGSDAERKTRISGIFKEISLEGKEKQRVTKFSKGMKQRLAIGRTMVTKPRLIVLDEPYLGLDFEGKSFLTNYLISLKKTGCTILLSSHDLTEIEKVCDKAIFIKSGEMKAENDLKNYGDMKSKVSSLEQMYAKVLM